jgi:hypothetical protein
MVHTENKNTHFVFKNYPPPSTENRAVYEIMSKIYGGAGEVTDDNIVLRMRIPCWIPQATNTHSQYVTLTAFPLQLWLQQNASVLRHKYIACRV